MTGRVAVWAVAVVAVVAIGLITACDPADPPVPNAATERVADGREYWGLASAPEHEAPRNHPDGYRREDWSVSWPDDVNVALGWKTVWMPLGVLRRQGRPGVFDQPDPRSSGGGRRGAPVGRLQMVAHRPAGVLYGYRKSVRVVRCRESEEIGP